MKENTKFQKSEKVTVRMLKTKTDINSTIFVLQTLIHNSESVLCNCDSEVESESELVTVPKTAIPTATG